MVVAVLNVVRFPAKWEVVMSGKGEAYLQITAY